MKAGESAKRRRELPSMAQTFVLVPVVMETIWLLTRKKSGSS